MGTAKSAGIEWSGKKENKGACGVCAEFQWKHDFHSGRCWHFQIESIDKTLPQNCWNHSNTKASGLNENCWNDPTEGRTIADAIIAAVSNVISIGRHELFVVVVPRLYPQIKEN